MRRGGNSSGPEACRKRTLGKEGKYCNRCPGRGEDALRVMVKFVKLGDKVLKGLGLGG
jgi:hypothetical protein